MVRILGKNYEAGVIPSGTGLKISFENPTTELFIEFAKMDFTDEIIEVSESDMIIGTYRHQRIISVTKYDSTMVVTTDGKTKEEAEISELQKDNEALWEALNLLTDDIIPSFFAE